jgi:hypothetical protein
VKHSTRQPVSKSDAVNAGREGRRAPGKTRPLAALGQLLTIYSVLGLQREAGNAAVCDLLDGSRPSVQRNGDPPVAVKVKPQVHKKAMPVDRLIGGEEYELAVETTPPGLDLGALPALTWKVTGPAKIAGDKSLQTEDVADPTSVDLSLTAAGITEELKLPIDPIASVVKAKTSVEPEWAAEGRIKNQVGVGEDSWLKYDLDPAVPARRLGGLEWEAKGPAVVTRATLPTAYVKATKTTGEDVTLNLKIQGGKSAGRVIGTETIHVIPPTGVAMEQKPGGVHHVRGRASAGFVGNWFFQPATVSFHNLEFKEEACASAMDGCFSRMQWAKDGHKANPRWAKAVQDVQDGKGTAIGGTDSVYSGEFQPIRDFRPPTSRIGALFGGGARVRAPYEPGDFQPGHLDWKIPVSYQIAGTAGAEPFDHELQHMECTDVGVMRISKLKVEVEKSADEPDLTLPEVAKGFGIVRAIPALPATP